MAFVRQLVAGLRLLVVMTVVLGVLYPAAVTLAARIFPAQADGSLVRVNGTVVGSSLLGQELDGAKWFQPRPSASSYSGQTSGGTNLSPASDAEAKARADLEAKLKAANPNAVGPVPEDALTSSGSGLDPDISVAYALWQVPRIAAARGLDPSVLNRLIEQNTDKALLGFIGQDAVNITTLNAALS